MQKSITRILNWKHILQLKCPSCGQGKLFATYLKQIQSCDGCAVKWGDYRADDGPAWLTIMVLGHILIPVAVYLAIQTEYDTGFIMLGVCAVAFFLVLLMLPFSKAIFLAVLWRTGAGAATTSEQSKDDL